MFVVPFVRLTVLGLVCIILFHDSLQLWRVRIEPNMELDVELVWRNLERHEASLSQQMVQVQLPANVGFRFFHCSFLLHKIILAAYITTLNDTFGPMVRQLDKIKQGRSLAIVVRFLPYIF